MSKSVILVAILIVVALASSELIFDKTVADDQTALPPKYALGDKWIFSQKQFPYGMTGIMTEEITSTSIMVSSYDCIELTINGGGAYGQGTGSWTMNGTQYEIKTDYSVPKSESAIDTKTPAFNETIITDSENNPPLIYFAFPLFVGKTWTATTTALTKVTHVLNGYLSRGNSTQSETTSYSVLRTEDVTVPAGNFQTFVIQMTEPDGSTSLRYYSAQAKMQVKELDYTQNGNLSFSIELLNYSVAEQTSTPTPTATPTTNPTTNPTQAPTTNPTAIQQPTSTLKPIVTSPSPTPSLSGNVSTTPTVPELSWLVIVPLLLSLFSVAMIIRHHQVKKV